MPDDDNDPLVDELGLHYAFLVLVRRDLENTAATIEQSRAAIVASRELLKQIDGRTNRPRHIAAFII